MAIVPQERLRDCDGFRVDSPRGPLGWVEETWLGPAGEPAALAVRALDARRALLLAEDVDAVLEEGETVVVRGDAKLLELEAPRIDDTRAPLRASWTTTGEVLEPSRLRPPPTPWVERPVWQVVAALYGTIIVLAALVMTLAFSVAQALA
jgi:hypothetical protein